VQTLGPVNHLRTRDGTADDGDIDSVGAASQQKCGASASTGLCGHDVVDQQQVRASRDRHGTCLIEGTAQSLSSPASTSGASPVPDRPPLQDLFQNGSDPGEFFAENFGEKVRCVESPRGCREASAGDGYYPVEGPKFVSNLPGQSPGQRLTRGAVAADFPPKNSGLARCLGAVEAKCFGPAKRRRLCLAGCAAGLRTRVRTMVAGVFACSESISAGGAEGRPARDVERTSAESARAGVEKACENVYIYRHSAEAAPFGSLEQGRSVQGLC